jgi:hypothetical protein
MQLKRVFECHISYPVIRGRLWSCEGVICNNISIICDNTTNDILVRQITDILLQITLFTGRSVKGPKFFRSYIA